MEKDKKLSRRKMIALSGAGAATLVGASLVTSAEAQNKAKKKPAATPKVPRRVLGKTGQKVPILLFGGAVNLDPRFDPKMAEALKYGVDYIDAAYVYGGGRCEPSVGAFVKRAK
ncbi:MAG: hypothetical protein AAGC55_14010, partial [Myxococcota bacterium]